ncbi:hypothetical protein CMV_005212 [Castanea mollissima]|uniref:PTM/DIR17-like Tudor domain-containing protein n=1 Tax=Castanea mollissima TaxID=60419 RepID=A0A8J4RT51_9ROSI|nr:hypothetical protein CMV_005212 [Castanea mollissima]
MKQVKELQDTEEDIEKEKRAKLSRVSKSPEAVENSRNFDTLCEKECLKWQIQAQSRNQSLHQQGFSKRNRNTAFGDWLEGRVVQKLFGNRYFSGVVTEFDKEAGWYRVVYEDGDFEDLDWHELEEVLQPLDITVPLRSLALKTNKKIQKLLHKSGKNVAQSRARRVKHVGSRGKNIVEYREAS